MLQSKSLRSVVHGYSDLVVCMFATKLHRMWNVHHLAPWASLVRLQVRVPVALFRIRGPENGWMNGLSEALEPCLQDCCHSCQHTSGWISMTERGTLRTWMYRYSKPNRVYQSNKKHLSFMCSNIFDYLKKAKVPYSVIIYITLHLQL